MSDAQLPPDALSIGQRLTRETLWLGSVNFARNMLDPSVDMKTLNEVAVKVFEAMEFLLEMPE